MVRANASGKWVPFDDDVDDDSEYFTLVFKGDILSVEGNVFKTPTPYGLPVAASMGDVLGKLDDLMEELDSTKD